MAHKTFAPQFVRLLKHLVLYATKHQSAMNAVMSDPQKTAVATIIAQYAAFADVDLDYQP